MAKLACVDKREGLVVALPCPTWWLASNVGERGGISLCADHKDHSMSHLQVKDISDFTYKMVSLVRTDSGVSGGSIESFDSDDMMEETLTYSYADLQLRS